MTDRIIVENIGQLVTLAPLVSERRFTEIQTSDLGIRESAWFASEGDRIVEIGTGNYAPRDRRGLRIDANQGLVLPGLIDAHTHPIFGGSRAREFVMRLEGRSYQEIAAAGGGILSTVRATREASDTELTELTKDRLTAMAEWGVTTIEAKSGYGLSVSEEIRHLRILNTIKRDRSLDLEITCLALHAFAKEHDTKQSYIEDVQTNLLPVVAREKLARWVDAFVESGYFEPHELDSFMDTARSLGLEIRIHADEFKESGAARAAARWHAKSADHLEEASDDGIAAMANSGCVAILLPGTSLYCKMKYTDAGRFRRAGVPLAVATDFNPGSCRILNLPQAATLATLYCGLTPAEALAGVTLVAARSLGREHEIGAIAPGYCANFCITAHPTWQDWIADFGQSRPRSVWQGGQPLR